MNPKTIMVAVDFGDTSERALTAAIEAARQFDAELHLVHVVSPVPITEALGPTLPMAVNQEVVSDAEKQLAAKIRPLTDGGLKVKTRVITHSALIGLLEAIDEIQPTLVVVGSHGRRGIQRALLGSVSEALVRRSPVPVLVVPTHERHDRKVAWACPACGHIAPGRTPMATCEQCHARPESWVAAEISDEPIDTGERAVMEGVVDQADPQGAATPDPQALFPVSPPGVGGNVNINPELRVRY